MTTVTVIPVMYRDANNYKLYEDLVFSGAITDEQRKALGESLDHGEYFIPEQVGLTHLGDGDNVWSSFPNSTDDHCWHELIPGEAETRDERERDFIEGTVDEFVAKMVAAHADGWEEAKYGKRFEDAEPYQDPDADDEEEEEE